MKSPKSEKLFRELSNEFYYIGIGGADIINKENQLLKAYYITLCVLGIIFFAIGVRAESNLFYGLIRGVFTLLYGGFAAAFISIPIYDLIRKLLSKRWEKAFSQEHKLALSIIKSSLVRVANSGYKITIRCGFNALDITQQNIMDLDENIEKHFSGIFNVDILKNENVVATFSNR